jgi:SAM-dependent methyltransferase
MPVAVGKNRGLAGAVSLAAVAFGTDFRFCSNYKMNIIRDLFSKFSDSSRKSRREIFHRMFRLDYDTKILDLGSEDGSNIARLLAGYSVDPKNVFIADIDAQHVASGASRYGFTPVVLPEQGPLPFETGFFDIVYCSSTLEHVTVSKDEIWKIRSTAEFRRRALESQTSLAREISRVGKQFFLQTPCRSFPVESHSWLPLVGMLPREVAVPLFACTNRFWVKKTIPDFYLLTRGETQAMFPDALIMPERRLGFTKSWMTVRTNKVPED